MCWLPLRTQSFCVYELCKDGWAYVFMCMCNALVRKTQLRGESTKKRQERERGKWVWGIELPVPPFS